MAYGFYPHLGEIATPCHPFSIEFKNTYIIIIYLFFNKGGGNMANTTFTLILYGLKIATPPI